MAKTPARRVIEGKVMPKEVKPDGSSQGLPQGNRGQGDNNSGKSIRGFRVGRGSI